MTGIIVDPTMNIDTTAPSIAAEIRARLGRIIGNMYDTGSDDADDPDANLLTMLTQHIDNSVKPGAPQNLWFTNDKPNNYVPDQFAGSGFFHHFNAHKPGNNYDWSNAGGQPSPVIGDGIIYIGDDWINSGLTRAWPAKTGVAQVTFDRMIIHELTHAITDPTNSAFDDTIGGIRYNYNEEIAAFVENVIYRPYAKHYGLADANIVSLGHDYTTILGGSAGDRYMYDGTGDLVTTDMAVSAVDGDVTFYAFQMSTGISIEKTYSHAGAIVNANTSNAYSRYITIEINAYDGVITESASGYDLNSFISNRVTPDAAYKNPQTALNSIHDLVDLIDTTLSSTDDKTDQFLFYAGIGEFFEQFTPYQTRLVALGADRFIDTKSGVQIDVSGPTALGSKLTPAVIAINDSMDIFEYGTQSFSTPQYQGALILGAAGIPTSPGRAGLNTQGARDDIVGSHGDDVIIAGNTEGRYGANLLAGGEGHDVIRAGTSIDKVKGGDGNDILIAAAQTYVDDGGNPKGMELDGGSGYDTVSYLESSTGIILNVIGNDTNTIVDGRTDLLTSIEMVIGTDHNDVMSARSGMTMIGGKGSDSIHLQSGAIAIGGADGDAFDMDVNPLEDSKYLIIGFDDDDVLSLNGAQHFGSQAVITGSGANQVVNYHSGTGANPFATSTDAPWEGSFWSESFYFGYDALNAYGGNAADINVDDFAMIQIRHSIDGQLTSTTDIFITGFKPGEGGLNFNSAIYGSSGYQIQDPVESGSIMPYSPTSVGLSFTQDVFF